MQTINERAEEMLDNYLDYSEHEELGGDLLLVAFYRKDQAQVWIVDMSEAECDPDAGKKIGLVLNRAGA